MTEQRRWLVYNTARGEARAGIGNRLNRSGRTARGGGELCKRGHLCDSEENEAREDLDTKAQPPSSVHGMTSSIRLG
jgi:hypothetical protein